MIHQSVLTNRILTRLSASDFDHLADRLEPVELPLSTVLVEFAQPMSHVFFLERGMASLVVFSKEGQVAEGGIIGREGFVAPAAALGLMSAPHKFEMQIGGAGHRIPIQEFHEILEKAPELRKRLLLFVHNTFVQATYSLLSNSVQTLNERLARWLLMCLDRNESADLKITHKYLAVILAVRRSSVTDALHLLEGHGLIKMDRGYVQIISRSGLEHYAGDAYGQPEADYRRLLGPL